MTQKEALHKMAKFCAYQERCQQEIRTKLFSEKLTSDEVENIISELISQGFLNEERFAKAYARGKFNIKKWGKIKITHGLKAKSISVFCIKKGLEEIDISEYYTTIENLILKKSKLIHETNPFLKKQKIAQFVISKGFESELVWECLDGFKDDDTL